VRAPRNPRRAYDHDGNEIPPATVASARALGMGSVMASVRHSAAGTKLLFL